MFLIKYLFLLVDGLRRLQPLYARAASLYAHLNISYSNQVRKLHTQGFGINSVRRQHSFIGPAAALVSIF